MLYTVEYFCQTLIKLVPLFYTIHKSKLGCEECVGILVEDVPRDYLALLPRIFLYTLPQYIHRNFHHLIPRHSREIFKITSCFVELFIFYQYTNSTVYTHSWASLLLKVTSIKR